MNQTFFGTIDASSLQQELIAAIGAPVSNSWYLNGSAGQVTFISIAGVPDPTATINAHLANALGRAKAAVASKIRSDASKIIGDVIGNLGNEYQKANTDAAAFKAANYTGTVPASVSSWATAKGWTNTQACDDILSAAANWLAAQDSIRANRLAKAEAAKNATTQAALDVVYSQWATYVAGMRTSLGV